MLKHAFELAYLRHIERPMISIQSVTGSGTGVFNELSYSEYGEQIH